MTLQEVLSDSLSREVFFDRNPGAELLRPLVEFMAEHRDIVWKGLYAERARVRAKAMNWAEVAAQEDPTGESRFMRETDQFYADAVDKITDAMDALNLILDGPEGEEYT